MNHNSTVSISEVAKPYMTVTSEQEKLINSYIDLVLKFNKSKSLTSVSTVDQWISNHIMDSIAAYSLLDARLDFQTVIDCGSGNGLPGVVFAILAAAKNIYLYDTDSKKCQFLKTVAHRLALSNVRVSNTSVLGINNVPRGTIFVYRAFSPIHLMHECISKYANTHCYFASTDHTYDYTSAIEYHYDLPDKSTRKLVIV